MFNTQQTKFLNASKDNCWKLTQYFTVLFASPTRNIISLIGSPLRRFGNPVILIMLTIGLSFVAIRAFQPEEVSKVSIPSKSQSTLDQKTKFKFSSLSSSAVFSVLK